MIGAPNNFDSFLQELDQEQTPEAATAASPQVAQPNFEDFLSELEAVPAKPKVKLSKFDIKRGEEAISELLTKEEAGRKKRVGLIKEVSIGAEKGAEDIFKLFGI